MVEFRPEGDTSNVTTVGGGNALVFEYLAMLVLAAFLGVMTYWGWDRYYTKWQLERSGVEAAGVITDFDVNNLVDGPSLCYAKYKFDIPAAGGSQTMQGESDMDCPFFTGPRDGEPIAVRYLPGNPAVSASSESLDLSLMDYCVIIAVLMSTLMFAGVSFITLTALTLDALYWLGFRNR